ncbi:hypothetical protein ACWEP4_41740 [Streptomyces sp. NPDC004227]
MSDDTRALAKSLCNQGMIWLRAHGRDEWPAEDPKRLKITRTRAERIAAGDA